MLGKEFAAQLVWQMQKSFAMAAYDATTRLSGFASECFYVILLWSRIRVPVNLNDVGYCFQMCGTG